MVKLNAFFKAYFCEFQICIRIVQIKCWIVCQGRRMNPPMVRWVLFGNGIGWSLGLTNSAPSRSECFICVLLWSALASSLAVQSFSQKVPSVSKRIAFPSTAFPNPNPNNAIPPPNVVRRRAHNIPRDKPPCLRPMDRPFREHRTYPRSWEMPGFEATIPRQWDWRNVCVNSFVQYHTSN